MYCLFCVLCIVRVYLCTQLLPPGGYPIAVKYIISYVNYHKFKISLRCTTAKLRVVVEVILVISCSDKSQYLRIQNNDAINMDLRDEVRG
jgi:hypothetical protein